MTTQTAVSGTPKAGASSSTFAGLGLDATLLSAVKRLGYAEPSPIQARAIPEVLAGRDVLAAAQTGTGKTAAFLLPTMQMLGHARKGEGPLMLVLTPTRELALQIEEVACEIAGRTHHTTASVIGGASYERQKRALSQGCDILIATPGRLIDLIHQGACHLGQTHMLVLDEADRMLDMGFLPDVRAIVAEMPEERQTLLFSATLDESILDNTRSLVHDPVSIEIAHKGTTAQTVEQYALAVSHDAKTQVLLDILGREGSERVIVFCNGKHRADALCKKLRRADISCMPIHGDRSQNQRQRALHQFADGMVDVLVATDVLARGIDVPEVSYVINYDVPHDDVESYIHRIGRTGRAGEEGWALSLVEPDDYLYLRDVEQLMDRVIPDYPRAEGLDLGDNPGELVSGRNPQDKLPSKKIRRRLERKHASERRAEASKRREEAAAGLEASAGEPLEHIARHVSDTPERAGKAKQARHAKQDAAERRQKDERRSGKGQKRSQDASGRKPHQKRRGEESQDAKAARRQQRLQSEDKGRWNGARKHGERTMQDDGRRKKRQGTVKGDWTPAPKKQRRRPEQDSSPKAFGMRKQHRMGEGAAQGAGKKKHGRRPGDHGGRA